MNSEMFLREVLESDICPANFEEIYKDFQRYQQAAIDTLNEFHRVCEKNNVPYQLAYGSLLGAIRDNGQIPWDYDVDVLVPYEEKDKLVEVLKRDLDEKFYFYCPEVDKHCRHFIMRLAPKGYRTEAVHVDVFYMVGAPENKKERIILKNKIAKLSNIRFAKLVDVSTEGMGRTKRMIRLLLKKFHATFYHVNKVEKDFENLCLKYKLFNSRFCVTADKFYADRDFLTDDFWNVIYITTENGVFRVPAEYKKILTMIYGNYEEYLPLENRIKELYDSYKRLKYFDDLGK